MAKFSTIAGIILLFFSLLPISLGAYHGADWLFQNQWVAFFAVHLLLLNFCSTRWDYAWLILCLAHGSAHLAHPAFHGTILNLDYNPYYDYLVHAAQCLCVYYYHRELFPIGVMGALIMVSSALLAHLDKAFYTTNFWLFASSWGVYGTIYQSMLLNRERNHDLFLTNIILWVLPYLGYLIPNMIPQWDYMMNLGGLFSMWYFNYFLTNYFFFKRWEGTSTYA